MNKMKANHELIIWVTRAVTKRADAISAAPSVITLFVNGVKQLM